MRDNMGLYRGKEKPNGEWVEGFLVDAQHIGNWLVAHPVDPETVGQFTGKHHKSGVKVFEGDILEYTNKDGSVARYVVEWDTVMGAWTAKWIGGEGAFSLGSACEFMELVGNIHDNPELLEVSK